MNLFWRYRSKQTNSLGSMESINLIRLTPLLKKARARRVKMALTVSRETTLTRSNPSKVPSKEDSAGRITWS
jgi:hypothetical protein